MIAIIGSGTLCSLVTYRYRHNMQFRTRYAFIITVLSWVVLCVAGALPLVWMENGMEFSDAVFESTSGLTTTGATVIARIESLSLSILLYRQLLQWIGGMGIIVLAVAVLPYLGIGGMQLYHSETPGPAAENKMTPRIAQTAKALWTIYIALTLLCALAYWVGGMTPFDAVAHSFSTVSIGGFSTHSESFAYFQSPGLYWIAIVFMLLSALNFSLHYFAWRQRWNPKYYFQDPECRFYLLFLGIATVSICGLFLFLDQYDSREIGYKGIFQVISVATTTGFTVDTFDHYLPGITFVVFMLSFVGACAGSTGGGIKAIRILLLLKQGYRELLRLLHPHGVFTVRLGKNPVPDQVIEAIWGFFAVYLILFISLMALLMLLGMDMTTAWSALGATLNNLGPGAGAVAQHYADVEDSVKAVLIFSMLLGRLEIFTILVLLLPTTWR